ncbi:MAG: hypothetical protein LBK40_09430 [Spirochaetaceae bacterium]|nr:hypothetical protein [Spirochaetaceae bacterium]
MPKKLILIISTVFLIGCISTKKETGPYFPDNINTSFIYRYIQEQIINNNENDTETEYLKILDFINESIILYKLNIMNFYLNVSLRKYIPLYDGILTFKETYGFNNTWDDAKKEYIKIAAIDLTTETGNIIMLLYDYNEIVDYWYQKTNSLLSEKYNVDEEIKRLELEIRYLTKVSKYW